MDFGKCFESNAHVAARKTFSIPRPRQSSTVCATQSHALEVVKTPPPPPPSILSLSCISAASAHVSSFGKSKRMALSSSSSPSAIFNFTKFSLKILCVPINASPSPRSRMDAKSIWHTTFTGSNCNWRLANPSKDVCAGQFANRILLKDPPIFFVGLDADVMHSWSLVVPIK